MERSTIFKNAVYHLPLGYTVSIKVSFMHHLQCVREEHVPRKWSLKWGKHGKTLGNIGENMGENKNMGQVPIEWRFEWEKSSINGIPGHCHV